MVGRVSPSDFRTAMLRTLSAADSSGSLQQDVIVTAYVQTIQAQATLPGSVATFDDSTDGGQAARLQFRGGVSTTLGLAVDTVMVTAISVSGSGRRRMQEGSVDVDYTAIAEEDAAAHFDNATFTEELTSNINEAGDALGDIAAGDLSSQTASVETDVTFEGTLLQLPSHPALPFSCCR